MRFAISRNLLWEGRPLKEPMARPEQGKRGLILRLSYIDEEFVEGRSGGVRGTVTNPPDGALRVKFKVLSLFTTRNKADG